MTRDEYKTKLASGQAELQALADEHVDVGKGMRQDIPLEEMNALRDAAQALWDEEPQVGRDALEAYRGLTVEDIARSVFSMGVMLGWRAARN